jgi:hypothetical protein
MYLISFYLTPALSEGEGIYPHPALSRREREFRIIWPLLLLLSGEA